MSNSEEEDLSEETVTYVYVPDENVYGTVVSSGLWSSMIEYFEGGVGYVIEIPNDEFIEVNQIGIGYINETGENL